MKNKQEAALHASITAEAAFECTCVNNLCNHVLVPLTELTNILEKGHNQQWVLRI